MRVSSHDVHVSGRHVQIITDGGPDAAFIELVGDPVAVLRGEQGRLDAEELWGEMDRAVQLLRSAGPGQTVSSLFPPHTGFIVNSGADTTVDVDRAMPRLLRQPTVGVSVFGLSLHFRETAAYLLQLHNPIRDGLTLRWLQEGRVFGEEVADRFREYPDPAPEGVSERARARARWADAVALEGYATLVYTHAAVAALARDTGTLAKNRAFSLSRMPIAVVRDGLPPRVQAFLEHLADDLTAHFESVLRRNPQPPVHRSATIPEDVLDRSIDVDRGRFFWTPLAVPSPFTVRGFLDQAWRPVPPGQTVIPAGAVVGGIITTELDELDTFGGRAALPLVALELRMRERDTDPRSSGREAVGFSRWQSITRRVDDQAWILAAASHSVHPGDSVLDVPPAPRSGSHVAEPRRPPAGGLAPQPVEVPFDEGITRRLGGPTMQLVMFAHQVVSHYLRLGRPDNGGFVVHIEGGGDGEPGTDAVAAGRRRATTVHDALVGAMEQASRALYQGVSTRRVSVEVSSRGSGASRSPDWQPDGPGQRRSVRVWVGQVTGDRADRTIIGRQLDDEVMDAAVLREYVASVLDDRRAADGLPEADAPSVTTVLTMLREIDSSGGRPHVRRDLVQLLANRLYATSSARPWAGLHEPPRLSHNERVAVRRGMDRADGRPGLPPLPEGHELDQLAEYLRGRAGLGPIGPSLTGGPKEAEYTAELAKAYAEHHGRPRLERGRLLGGAIGVEIETEVAVSDVLELDGPDYRLVTDAFDFDVESAEIASRPSAVLRGEQHHHRPQPDVEESVRIVNRALTAGRPGQRLREVLSGVDGLTVADPSIVLVEPGTDRPARTLQITSGVAVFGQHRLFEYALERLVEEGRPERAPFWAAVGRGAAGWADEVAEAFRTEHPHGPPRALWADVRALRGHLELVYLQILAPEVGRELGLLKMGTPLLPRVSPALVRAALPARVQTFLSDSTDEIGEAFRRSVSDLAESDDTPFDTDLADALYALGTMASAVLTDDDLDIEPDWEKARGALKQAVVAVDADELVSQEALFGQMTELGSLDDAGGSRADLPLIPIEVRIFGPHAGSDVGRALATSRRWTDVARRIDDDSWVDLAWSRAAEGGLTVPEVPDAPAHPAPTGRSDRTEVPDHVLVLGDGVTDLADAPSVVHDALRSALPAWVTAEASRLRAAGPHGLRVHVEAGDQAAAAAIGAELERRLDHALIRTRASWPAELRDPADFPVEVVYASVHDSVVVERAPGSSGDEPQHEVRIRVEIVPGDEVRRATPAEVLSRATDAETTRLRIAVLHPFVVRAVSYRRTEVGLTAGPPVHRGEVARVYGRLREQRRLGATATDTAARITEHIVRLDRAVGQPDRDTPAGPGSEPPEQMEAALRHAVSRGLRRSAGSAPSAGAVDAIYAAYRRRWRPDIHAPSLSVPRLATAVIDLGLHGRAPGRRPGGEAPPPGGDQAPATVDPPLRGDDAR